MTSSGAELNVLWASDAPGEARAVLERAQQQAQRYSTAEITINLVQWRGSRDEPLGVHYAVGTATAALLVLDSSEDLAPDCYELLAAAVSPQKPPLLLAPRELGPDLVVKLQSVEAVNDKNVSLCVRPAPEHMDVLFKFMLEHAKDVVSSSTRPRLGRGRRPRL